MSTLVHNGKLHKRWVPQPTTPFFQCYLLSMYLNTYVLILFTNPSEYSPNLDDMQYDILQTCKACVQTLIQAQLPDSVV